MKIYKLLFLAVLSCLVLSCEKDGINKQSEEEINGRIASDQFDDSYLGIYKGLFSTNDGLIRGTVLLNLTPNNLGVAEIKLSSGETIHLESRSLKLTVDQKISDLVFSSEGLEGINITLKFSVDGNGLNPSISDVVFDNKGADILIAKNLSRAPLNTITGTYMRTTGTGSFPISGRTWNIMSIGTGNQTYATQIWYGGVLYHSTDGTQNSCVDNGNDTETCDVSGFAVVSGYDVTWSGTHTYDIFDDNFGCSEMFGTWSAPAYGNSSGTFISDSDCSTTSVANDFCIDATPINLGDSVVGFTSAFGISATNTDTPNFCDDNLTGSADGVGVWYEFSSNTDAMVSVSLEGSDFDTQLRVFSGNCEALVCVANDDDSGVNPQLSSVVEFSATAGETYYFFIGGYDDEVGEYNLSLTEVIEIPVPVNDLCQNAVALSCGESYSGTIAGATDNGSPTTCTDDLYFGGLNAGTEGVWFSITTDENQSVTVDTEDSTGIVDTQLRVFSGSCGSLICVGAGDDTDTSLLSSYTFQASANETYLVFLAGYDNEVGEYTIKLTCEDPEPVVEFELDLTCGDFMIDNGEASNYQDNSYDIYTIDAGIGNTISLNFILFDLEDYYDDLVIYDGEDTSAPIITTSVGGASNMYGQNGGFTWTDLQDDSIVSTGQYLTLIFSSDLNTNYAGFLAEVECISGRSPFLGRQTTSSEFNPTRVTKSRIPKGESRQSTFKSETTRILYNKKYGTDK